jgi:predicted DNA-binding transcriptional regulator AlpA
MNKNAHRLIKQRDMLLKYFGGISDSTAERRLYPREDFPKPLDAFPGMNIRDESAVESFVEKLIAERESV